VGSCEYRQSRLDSIHLAIWRIYGVCRQICLQIGFMDSKVLQAGIWWVPERTWRCSSCAVKGFARFFMWEIFRNGNKFILVLSRTTTPCKCVSEYFRASFFDFWTCKFVAWTCSIFRLIQSQVQSFRRLFLWRHNISIFSRKL
jgi:hypothetical protein